MAAVVDLLHACCSWLFVLIQSSQRFAICELCGLIKRVKVLGPYSEGLQCTQQVHKLKFSLAAIFSEKPSQKELCKL